MTSEQWVYGYRVEVNEATEPVQQPVPVDTNGELYMTAILKYGDLAISLNGGEICPITQRTPYSTAGAYVNVVRPKSFKNESNFSDQTGWRIHTVWSNTPKAHVVGFRDYASARLALKSLTSSERLAIFGASEVKE